MSPEVALLSETWQLFKNSVHISERVEMADALLDLFDEHLDLVDLETWKHEFDKSMKVAIRARYEDELDDEDDDWE